MKLPHLFNNTCYTKPNTTSYWPSCTQQPKTLSFRDEALLFQRGVNGVCYPTAEPPKSSSALIEDLLKEDGGETIERVIRHLKSDHRLFFEHHKIANDSVMDRAESSNGRCSSQVDQNKSVSLLSMESRDPYLDFKKSMEEMVEAYHGVMDWDWLHELLGCYLKVNQTGHHEFIIGAFLDLLVSLDLDSFRLSFNKSPVVASPSTSSSSNISRSCCSSSNSPADETAVSVE